jgi:hypothetical protein
VMNYAVMYEYAVDRNSGQFKAAFNQIKNEPNVFTYNDTAIPTSNSDSPYSFVWMDLRAEPIVLSVPAVDPKRYYSVMLCDDPPAVRAAAELAPADPRAGTPEPARRRAFGRRVPRSNQHCASSVVRDRTAARTVNRKRAQNPVPRQKLILGAAACQVSVTL